MISEQNGGDEYVEQIIARNISVDISHRKLLLTKGIYIVVFYYSHIRT